MANQLAIGTLISMYYEISRRQLKVPDSSFSALQAGEGSRALRARRVYVNIIK
ncbi:hypothetical protein QT971_19885 [Microcoleus sp. herbarium19]|uniref:hypothetical protein n=1 Tax=unclassified Microcoleus TaxID=2642155 RepID=UPI002FD4C386